MARQEYENSYLGAQLKNTPEYEEAKEWFAYAGKNFDTGEDMMPKLVPERELGPGSPVEPMEGTVAWYDKPQPGGGQPGWRGAVRDFMNWTAVGIGKGAQAALEYGVVPGMTGVEVDPETAASVGEGVATAARLVGTQAIPSVAQLPQRFLGALEEIPLALAHSTDWLAKNLFNYPTDLAGPMEEQGRAGTGMLPLDLLYGGAKAVAPSIYGDKTLSEALKYHYNQIITPPQTEGEAITRELLSVMEGMAATAGVAMAAGAPTALLEMGTSGAGMWAGRAALAGASDFTFADPNSTKLYQVVGRMFGGSAQQDVEDVSAGKISHETFAARMKGRLGNFAEAATMSYLFDGVAMAGKLAWAKVLRARAQRLQQAADVVIPNVEPSAADEALVRAGGVSEAELDQLMDDTAQHIRGLGFDDEADEWLRETRAIADPVQRLEATNDLIEQMNGVVESMGRGWATQAEAQKAGAQAQAAGAEAFQREAADKEIAFVRKNLQEEAAAAKNTEDRQRILGMFGKRASGEQSLEEQAVTVGEAFAKQEDSVVKAVESDDLLVEGVSEDEPSATVAAYVRKKVAEGGPIDLDHAAARLTFMHNVTPEKAKETLEQALDKATTPSIKDAVTRLSSRGKLGKLSAALVLTPVMWKLLDSSDPQQAEAGVISELVEAAIKAVPEMTDDVARVVAKEAVQEATHSAAVVKGLPTLTEQAAAFGPEHVLAGINSPEDIARHIESSTMREAIERGTSSSKVLHDSDVEKMLQHRGVSQRRINEMVSGDVLVKDVYGALKVADETFELAQVMGKKYLAGEATEEAFEKAANVAIEANVQAMGVRSQMGRGFRMLQRGKTGRLGSLKEAMLEGAEGGSLLAKKIEGVTTYGQLAEVFQDMTAADASRVLKKVSDPTFKDVLMEMYYFNKLFRPTTQLKNATSFVKNAAVNVSEKFSAATWAKLTGNSEHTYTEAAAAVKGYFRGHRTAMEQAKLSWKNPTHSDLLFRDTSVYDATGRSLQDGRARETLLNWYQRKGIDPEHPLAKAGLYMAQGLNYPGKLLATVDNYAKVSHYMAEAHAHAERKGIIFGSAEWDAFINDVPEDLAKEWMHKSRILTHQVELDEAPEMGHAWVGTLGQKLTEAQRKHPVVRAFAPFIKTQTNALRWNFDRLPVLGALNGRFYQDVIGESATAATRNAALARQTTGFVGMGLLGLYAYEGNITGSAPRNPAIREAWLAAHPEHSFRVPGTDKWISYDPQNLLGLLMASSADAVRAAGTDDNVAEQIVHSTFLALDEATSDSAVLEPFKDLIELLGTGGRLSEENISERQGRIMTRWLRKELVPGVITEASKFWSPAMKEATNLREELNRTIPGWGVERLDINGEPLMTGYGYDDSLVHSGIAFMGVKYQTREDPHAEEFAALNVGIQRPKRFGKTRLTGEEINKVLAWAGPIAKQQRDEVMQSPMWQTMGEDEKREYLKAIYYSWYDAGKQRLLDDPLFERRYMQDLAGENQKG